MQSIFEFFYPNYLGKQLCVTGANNTGRITEYCIGAQRASPLSLVRDFKNKGFLGRKESLRSIFARFEGVLARFLNIHMILFANLQRY